MVTPAFQAGANTDVLMPQVLEVRVGRSAGTTIIKSEMINGCVGNGKLFCNHPNVDKQLINVPDMEHMDMMW